MKKIVILIACCLSFSLANAASVPQAFTVFQKGAYSIIPMGVFYGFSSKRKIKDGGGPGIGLAYYFNRHWAAELDAAYFSSEQKRDRKKNISGQYYTLNGLYYFNAGSYWRPYLSASVGGMHLSRTSTNEPSSQTNIGVGTGIVLFIHRHIGLRLGANDYYNTTGGTRNDYAVHADVMLTFGEKSEEATSKYVAPPPKEPADAKPFKPVGNKVPEVTAYIGIRPSAVAIKPPPAGATEAEKQRLKQESLYE